MRAVAAIVLILLVFLASFFLKEALKPGGPVTPEGESPAACARLVSLSPGITETLFALDLGGRVVGVTRYCTYPPEARRLPQVGGFLDPNYELLLALRPDLILLTPFHRDLWPELERLGMRYEVVGQDTVADIRDSILKLGALCGRQEQAGALAVEMDRRLADAAARAATRPRVRVLMTTGREMEAQQLNEIYAISSGSFLSDLLGIAGGENCVTGKIAEYPALSAEGILQLNPDVIIEFGETASEEASAAALASWQSLSGLKAVRRGRVHYLGGPQYTIPGPRILETLAALEQCLVPEGEGVSS